jgi:hypothetical protein
MAKKKRKPKPEIDPAFAMRDREDVLHVFSELGEDEDYRSWEGDSFRFGFLMGKFAALAWVLGDPIADVKNHYDFEDFTLERNSTRRDPSDDPETDTMVDEGDPNT